MNKAVICGISILVDAYYAGHVHSGKQKASVWSVCPSICLSNHSSLDA